MVRDRAAFFGWMDKRVSFVTGITLNLVLKVQPKLTYYFILTAFITLKTDK